MFFHVISTVEQKAKAMQIIKKLDTLNSKNEQKSRSMVLDSGIGEVVKGITSLKLRLQEIQEDDMEDLDLLKPVKGGKPTIPRRATSKQKDVSDMSD
jgi:hypothetical protein